LDHKDTEMLKATKTEGLTTQVSILVGCLCGTSFGCSQRAIDLVLAKLQDGPKVKGSLAIACIQMPRKRDLNSQDSYLPDNITVFDLSSG
jgi:hypothetical protein